MRGRLHGLWLVVTFVGSGAAAAEWQGPGFVLTYDQAAWHRVAAAPPVLVALSCITAACSEGTTLTVVADPRLLPGPGVSPRSPGAVSAALLAVRTAALVPGRRLIAEGPALPARAGSCPALQARFAVEQPDLSRSALLDAMLPRADGAWHIVLAGPSLPAGAIQSFAAVLAGLQIQSCR